MESIIKLVEANKNLILTGAPVQVKLIKQQKLQLL